MSAPSGGSEQRPVRKRRLPRAMILLFLLFALTVCLYLARLEAHTRADIFLPVNYHSALTAKAPQGGAPSDADLLDIYYEDYAQQEGRPYTVRQDSLLSRLAYIKAPQGFRGEAPGLTVGALCDAVERILAETAEDPAQLFGRTRQEILDITADIGAHRSLCALEILEYIDDASGFAGYVFKAGDEITAALRGTDDAIDMADNFLLLPFNVSVQYQQVRGLLNRYAEAPRIWLTGHSKGGHNAIYAASIDPRCRATGFNAPGFGIFLSDAQHDGLDRGVNYVINGDITGFLLFHLERRAVLESAALSANRHRLDNFFSVDELTVAERIQPLSVAAEWVTQIMWLLLLFLAAYGVIALVKRMGQQILRTDKERRSPR